MDGPALPPADLGVKYRVLCADLLGGTIREELRVSDLKWSKILNAPGAMSGWVSLDDPKCTRANLDPGATAIYIERGGLLVWGGILWTAKVDTVSRKLDIGAEGFWSYFQRRQIKNRTSMVYATSTSINRYVPDNDSTKTDVSGTPDATNLFNNVDGTFSPSSGIQSATPGNFGFYDASLNINGGDLAGLTISAIRLTTVAACTPGNQALQHRLNISGTPYIGQTQVMSTAATAMSTTWTTNPSTGLPWTTAQVEAFGSTDEVGFVFFPPVNPGDATVYQMYLDVSWGAGQTAVFQGVDQLGIARDLINNAQAQTGGNIGIIVGTELTTDNGGLFAPSTQTYHSYERKNVGEAVSAMASALGGFDFDIVSDWDSTGTMPINTLKLYYPRKGRRNEGLVFNHNITGFSSISDAVDASTAANSVTAMGSGDGDDMNIATATDTSMLSRYPLLEDSISYKDILDPTALQSLAAAETIRRSTPIEIPSISKAADTWPDVGSFQVGDEGFVVISDAWVQFNAFLRIQSLEVTVSNEGQETMTPTFVSADLFA